MLFEALVAGDQAGVAAALRGRSEADRRPVAAELVPAVRSQDTFGWLVLGPEGELRWETRRNVRRSDAEMELEARQPAAVQLALAGTASLTQLRRLGAWRMDSLDDHWGSEVLLERRPPWLAEWAAWMLGARTLRRPWGVVRGLVRAGAIERPPARLYFDSLLLASREPPHAPGLLERDPGLVDEVWELLAFDGGEESLRAADNRGAGWSDAIRTCSADGRMPRERVLDAVLDALAIDLSAYSSVWYIDFWRELAVTPAERQAREPGLRRLLGAFAAPAVAFAVEELVRCDGAPPAAELATALAATAKKTVRGALKLLDRGDDEERALVATEALAHEAADIQGEVLDRLERWGVPADALARHLDGLAATQRPRAEALLGVSATPEAPAADNDPTARVAAIPDPIRTALAFGGPVPEAPVEGEPVLGPPAPPIATLDELTEVFAVAMLHWWENRDERLLDGILRHCGRREAFDGPLRQFVPDLEKLAGWEHLTSVLQVATAWLTGNDPPPPHPILGRCWDLRVYAAGRRAARGAAAPLLALPTHVGGWITPEALVERLGVVGDDADEVELAQALLRLAPGEAADLPGRAGALVRCALGGEPVEDDGPAAAAARAVAGLPEPARIAFRINLKAEREIDRVQVRLLAPRGGRADGPLAEHLADVTASDDSTRWIPPDPTAWPARRDLACAGIIGRLGWNLSDAPQEWGAEALLDLLLRTGEPLTPTGLRMVVQTLCSADQREYLLAVDVLVDAIEHGRADADSLAPHARTDLGLVKTTRLAARLTSLAAAGPLHRAVVRDLLDSTVDALAAISTRMHTPLLELFDELSAQTGVGVRSEPARAFLATLSGSSKGAKAARALLARDGEPPDEERRLALEARSRRAERWLTAPRRAP